MVTANLCKCNNCDNILIDQNPQINAKEYPLTGEELEMQYIEEDAAGEKNYWVCPICLTDGFLIDM
jgi:hypothetical protein